MGKDGLALDVEGICTLMENCAKYRVSLTYRDLRIEIKDPTAERNPAVRDVSDPDVGETSSGKSDSSSPEEKREEARQAFVSKADLEEMRLAQLMTDDPTAYEQEMIDVQLRGSDGSGKDA